MDQRLQDVLQNRVPNYQQPFFGVAADESEESLHSRIRQLHEHGLFSMVLEYHNASGLFGLAKFDDIWWEKLRWISTACGELGMTFWIQDAAPFPTGAANGWFAEEPYKHLSKKFIIEKHLDVRGPVKDGLFSIGRLLRIFQGDVMAMTRPRSSIPDRLLHVVAIRRSADGISYDPATARDLSADVHNGMLRCDLDDGLWRIFAIAETHNGGRPNFMNLLDPASVRVLIDAVHEPHYQHLKDELGHTWRGFFYDEPEIGNLEGYVFDSLPGRKHNGASIPLPWSPDMPGEMICRLGPDYVRWLPALWSDCGASTGQIRYALMDAATRLIAQSYNRQVGAWCTERRIGYIGHVLEDEGSHARLGCGAGHFFRVQEGQQMAGVDLISAQVLPGLDDEGVSWYAAPDSDGEFYHYGLAKLASSAAHIDPAKQGRSVCEFLALYGPVAGTRLRKFVIDHLLVNGINNLIPADPGIQLLPECSRQLNTYVNRLCHLLHDGRHVAPVAVLYHAEAEWSGDSQPFHRPGKVLIQHQLDYDVVPADVFTRRHEYGTKFMDGQLIINQERYQALVIPYSQFIPRVVAELAAEAARAGFPVVFCDRLPQGICEGLDDLPTEMLACPAVPLDKLAGYLRKIGVGDIQLSDAQPNLRCFHYQRGNLEFFLFHNEDPHKAIETIVELPTRQPIQIYDAMTGRCCRMQTNGSLQNKTPFKLCLKRYETVLLIAGDLSDIELTAAAQWPEDSDSIDISENWTVNFESLDHNPAPEPTTLNQLTDLGAADRYPNFYGWAIYRKTLTIGQQIPHNLSLGYAAECARVSINGRDAGLAVAEPYRFSLEGMIKTGVNELEIAVLTPLARSADEAVNPSQNLLASLDATALVSLEPCGLVGPVRLF